MFEVDELDLDVDDDFRGSTFGKNDSIIVDHLRKISENEEENNTQCVKRVKSTNSEITQSVLQNCKSNSALKKTDLAKDIASKRVNIFNKSNEIKSVLNDLNNSGSAVRNSNEFLKNETRKMKTGQRKFPGPAGLLPDKPPKNLNDSTFLVNQSSEDLHQNEQNEDLILCSQSSASLFTEAPYRKLMSDFNMDEPNCLLNKYTISWVRKRVLNKKLYGRKVPFLAVVLTHLDHGTLDPILTLRDPTGELYGTLHRKAWYDMGGRLHAGAAMVLKQVGVLTTGAIRRQVFLNITVNNIVTIYSSSDFADEVETNTINPVSLLDLLKSVEEWQNNARLSSSPDTPNKNVTQSLFGSVHSEQHQRLINHASSAKISFSEEKRVANVGQETYKPLKNSLSTKNSSRGTEALMDVVNHLQKKTNQCKNFEHKNLASTSQDKAKQTLNQVESCNFQLSLDDDFADIIDFTSLEKIENSLTQTKRIESSETVDPRPIVSEILAAQKEKIPNTSTEPTSGDSGAAAEPATQTRICKVLTQAESLIFQEVLSGIDLDEFEF